MIGELAALGSAVLWALASALFSTLGARVPAVALNLLKTVVGLLLMQATLLAVAGRAWPVALAPTDLGWLSLSGLIGLTLGDTFYFEALRRIGPGRALLLWALIPPITALSAVPILGEPLTPRMIVGITLTGAGVTWVLRERTADSDGPPRSFDWAGISFGIAAVLCQCGGSLTAKLGGRTVDAVELSVVRLAAGAIGLAVMTLVRGQLTDVARVFRSGAVAGRVLLATVLGTYVGIWLQMLALQNALAGVVATLTATSPIFVLPVAHFALKEHVSERAVFGALVAVAGVAVLMLG